MSNAPADDLGGFLRSRRARIQPRDVGLPAGDRRRVPGLRREEVAQLAGVSVDYYVRLEQGRDLNVSDAVLDSVARVLRLDPTEHAHLRILAHPPRDTAPASSSRPGIQGLLDVIGAPAFVLGRCMDVLAWNARADAVMDFSRMERQARNMARHAFLNPEASAFYPDWEAVAAETAAHLRLDSARHPADRRLATMVAELSAANPVFERLWTEHQVKEKSSGGKRLCHPLVGEFEVGYETLTVPGAPDLLIVVYTTETGSAAAAKLALLLDHAERKLLDHAEGTAGDRTRFQTI
ncbi:helix-turn-helix transcriptional regulator [Streptosporangium sp. NBC_01639]|uniref:helix-turn-helix transcriptional regulator n=1 Tax=Streptosporangium sp. NBC_01639 TaxID=2975948 RepID=UPI00386CEAF7|nr:helix-turn-helix transcriptional regulator [Streptosporangium sp. NBC_01639]